jgi:hypothetical protein
MPVKAVHCAALKLAAAAAIGLLIPVTAHPFAIAITAFVPVLWLSHRHRGWAYASSGAYYLSAIWPVVPVVHRFNGSWLIGIAIWAGVALLLALPWLILRPRTPKQAFWCGPAAMLLTVIPPLGIISVACPLSAAGYIFPGTKIAGLLAALFLPGAIIWRPRATLLIASAVILLANVASAVNPPSKPDWEGVNTIADPTQGAFGDFRRIEAMLDRAEASPAKVIVFPEATIRNWTPTTLAFFEDRIGILHEEGKTILVGALLPSTIGGYRNVIETFGSTTAVMDQRVPVPLGMWIPFSSRGVRLNAFGPSFMYLHGQKAGVFICYENLISWPAVVMTLREPNLVVSVANQGVARGTGIPSLQAAYSVAWSKLWRAAMITASAS